jgi:hypothetical protein
VPAQNEIEIIKYEIERKGYAANCHPDSFHFFVSHNVCEYLDLLNNDQDKDKNHATYGEDFNDFYVDYIELDEPWGNCGAIYLADRKNINLHKALEALNIYADNFVKLHPEETRTWR